MFYKSDDTSSNGIPCSPGRQFTLFLTGILALMLVACGGGSGGGGGGGGGSVTAAQCTLTADQLNNLTPDQVATLPAACDGISFFDVPFITGLFILGTEEVDEAGETVLKLYVHGVNQDGTPMTTADFGQATVTVNGVAADPAAWNVAQVLNGEMLSIALLADYSLSITDADLAGMGDLYDIVLNRAPAGFEGETINFSSTLANVPAITVKPEPFPNSWTTSLPALLAANDLDPAQPRNSTTLYDAMGTGLMGPLDDAYNAAPGDGLGLVERPRPATLLMVQTDGEDNDSLVLTKNDVVSLTDRCRTTVIMVGTFQSQVNAQVLEELAGTRGAFVNALNTNFLEAAITSYAESLHNLVVFTLTPATGFRNSEVKIEVDGFSASATEPFNIDGGCQIVVS